MKLEIGRLSNIPPRDAWQHEARDFTPWLSENLDQLGEVIGLKLEPEGVEVAVGAFSADILARDMQGRLVLIENQLDTTDHSHLGQVLTYMSGLEAEIVIWIATEFREQHLSAISWLNENTADSFAFFAVRLRVVRIGDSAPAPMFDVLGRPNAWERQMQQVVREKTGESSAFAEGRRAFWRRYLERYPEDAALGVKETGSPSNWLIPEGDTQMVVSIYRAKTGVGVFLRGPRGETPAETQARLLPHAQEFERLVGVCKHIGDDDNHPVDSIDIDMDDHENWDRAIDWMHERGHAFLDAATSLFGAENAESERTR
ncbi:hypothetical protein F2Q65_17295 [Thiohalocapsa marina]|uniref:DUF4268 domain-containing protein n=1 Tax=Thiohalocapsa marina TaxID=424902 RepID=A0A5M8FCW9_9GAMM|nr:DUF4268 domain-containing protein [Thiohalocapsa marina]KAA6182728.1 hypothetical protein F2Q65_17295 [Thiohalocapsa marina]